jgi:hypothetical protein
MNTFKIILMGISGWMTMIIGPPSGFHIEASVSNPDWSAHFALEPE